MLQPALPNGWNFPTWHHVILETDIFIKMPRMPSKCWDPSSSPRIETNSLTWWLAFVIPSLHWGRQAEPWGSLASQPSKLWVSKCKVDGSFGLVYTYAHTKTTGVVVVCNIYRREKKSKEFKSPMWKWPTGSWALCSYCLPPARQDLRALISACSGQVLPAVWLLHLEGDPCQFSVVIVSVHRKSEGIRPGGLPRSYWQIASHSSLFLLYSCFYSRGGYAHLWTSRALTHLMSFLLYPSPYRGSAFDVNRAWPIYFLVNE